MAGGQRASHRLPADRPDRREAVRPVGSRLPLDYARETGANFLTAGALDAAEARTAIAEAHQSFDHQRLWADLLWSPTLAFNLFGDPAADLGWPTGPSTLVAGRARPPARGPLRPLTGPVRRLPQQPPRLRRGALVLDLDDGTQGVVAVDVNYHE